MTSASKPKAGQGGGEESARRPPFGEVLKELPPGPGVREDPDIAKNEEFPRSLTPEECKKYRGEWIAVAGGELVAHGKNGEHVLDEGWKAGKGEVYMEYIYATLEEVPLLYNL